jgi:hypothetical protein
MASLRTCGSSGARCGTGSSSTGPARRPGRCSPRPVVRRAPGCGRARCRGLGAWVRNTPGGVFRGAGGCWDAVSVPADHGDDGLFEMTPVERPVVERGPVDKTFRPFAPDQAWLVPPSVDDWLPQEHLARFIADLVDEHLDLSVLYADYREGRGAPPFNPRLMVRVGTGSPGGSYGTAVTACSARRSPSACDPHNARLLRASRTTVALRAPHDGYCVSSGSPGLPVWLPQRTGPPATTVSQLDGTNSRENRSCP